MRRWELGQFGVEQLQLANFEPTAPGPGEVQLRPVALSLNYRDLMVVRGTYNPRLPLPVTPVSDAAGVITAVGDGVAGIRIGDRVMTHFVAGWAEGRFRSEYVRTTLGTPGPGLAAERVNLPAGAVLPIPTGYDDAEAATLPIAALTAWSALVTEGSLAAGGSMLTLGTGGVSLFAVQLAKAIGATVYITSSSDAKLARARQLGADHGINYRTTPEWDKEIARLTERVGVDVVVETGGIATLSQSLRAVRGGGVVAMLGALTGRVGEVDLGPIVMRRIKLAGIMVDSRAVFGDLIRFLAAHRIEPVIDARFPFAELPLALRHMAEGNHFGKIVIEV